jgi:hypothetical protein
MSRIIRLAVLPALLAGCVGPVQRALTEGTLDKITIAPRQVRIVSVEVTDERPPAELEELTPDTRFFIPAIVWWQHLRQGHRRPPANLYSLNPVAELRQVVEHAVNTAGIGPSSGAGPALRLRVRLQHLYGVTHSWESFAVVYLLAGAAAVSSIRTFAPYGYASGVAELYEEGGRLVGQRAVHGYFEPNLHHLMGASAAGKLLTDKLTFAAVQAAAHLAGNVVRAVEPLLGRFAPARPMATDTCSTFFLTRHTPDGLFLEVAAVNVETGEIISDVVERRWMEPYAGVDEWVIDPYHGGNQRLTQQEYATLVERLKGKYEVRWSRDVRVAHFFGVKKPLGPSPAP